MPDASTSPAPADPAVALPQVIREVEEFSAAAGWDQPPQLFALVSTRELLSQQPELGEQLDPAAPFTPIAQEPLADSDLAESLAGIVWPPAVSGCAIVQEIVVLPPDAEAELTPAGDESDSGGAVTDDASNERMRRIAQEHPQRREARLVAGVLRDGPAACVLRLRGDADSPDEIVEHPELAPNLIRALRETLSD